MAYSRPIPASVLNKEKDQEITHIGLIKPKPF